MSSTSQIHWPIAETYLKREYCAAVDCKKPPKYECLTDWSEDEHDTMLACEDHVPQGSALKFDGKAA